MKKIVLWIFGILFFGSLAFFAFFTEERKNVNNRQYEPSPLTVSIDWEISSPFDLQIFYLKSKNERFNQESSVRKKVTPDDTHVEVVLPASRIYNFRIDFGSKPEKVVLKKVEIKGDIYLNFSNWNDYAYVNISKHKIHHDDNSLELYSDSIDPYMVFMYPFVLDEKK